MNKDELAKINTNFKLAAIFTVAILSVGTMFYHFVEGLRYIDAVYFSVITLATVGYGDIVPHTDVGKLFTCVYVLVGIGILGTFANLLLRRSVAKRRYSKSKE